MADKFVKAKYWTFLLYFDSAPDNWVEILRQTGCSMAISPVHDRDVQPTGEVKKSHRHIITCFPNPTTFNNMKRITDSVNSPIPQSVSSIRGTYAYLTHKNDPDKAQYDSNQIIYLNGFCPEDYFDLTKSEQYRLVGEIMDFVRERKIYEYADLMYILRDEGLIEYFDFAFSHTFFFTGFMRSRREGMKYSKFEDRL